MSDYMEPEAAVRRYADTVKHLFNDENMIEFDDFDYDITLTAKIET